MPRSVTLVAMLAAASLSAQTAEPSSAPPARVIVQVLGPDLAPLRDVTAWFEAPNRQSHRIVASGRTDADGVVSFERIPQASYNLRLRGPGVPLGWAHHKFAVNCPIVDRLVVRMPRLGSIRGQLTHSETGEPMVHRLVELTSRSGGPSQLCTVQTDHEGRYRFDMVGPGHYVVVPDRARLRGMVGFVKVQPGSAATHDLRGIVAPTVHGVVRDSNGVPVAGATVECKDRVSWMLSGSPIPATTDTTGRFSLRLTPSPPPAFASPRMASSPRRTHSSSSRTLVPRAG